MALIKMIGGKDYTQQLKNQRLASIGLLLVGIVGIIGYFTLVPGSGLEEFAKGFYIGGASGITLGALILFIRCTYLLHNPAAYQKAKVKDTDERSKSIIHRSFEIAGSVTFFTAAAALFVLCPLSMDAFRAVMGMIVLYAFTFVATNCILEKKM